MKKNKIRKIMSTHILILVVLAAYIVIISVTDFGCPILHMTGIPCPGCGLTRAYLRLFCGDVRGALVYHPLFWFAPVLLFAAFHRNTKMLSWLSTKKWNVFLIIGAMLFLLLYFLRLLVFHNIPY